MKWKFYPSLSPCHHKSHALPWGLSLSKGPKGGAGQFKGLLLSLHEVFLFTYNHRAALQIPTVRLSFSKAWFNWGSTNFFHKKSSVKHKISVRELLLKAEMNICFSPPKEASFLHCGAHGAAVWDAVLVLSLHSLVIIYSLETLSRLVLLFVLREDFHLGVFNPCSEVKGDTREKQVWSSPHPSAKLSAAYVGSDKCVWSCCIYASYVKRLEFFVRLCVKQKS